MTGVFLRVLRVQCGGEGALDLADDIGVLNSGIGRVITICGIIVGDVHARIAPRQCR